MMQDAAVKTAPQRKGLWQLALLVIIPSLAVGLAWYLYFFGSQFIPDNRTNKGELILPPVSFQTMSLNQNEARFTLDDLEGRWGILVVGDAQCSDKPCQEALYQSRQAHIALGRESDRVVRLVISPESQSSFSQSIQEEHPGVIWLGSDASSVLKALGTQTWPAHRFYIVDPLGNIMMQYKPGQYGGDLLKDLQKLLKASNIG
jgi:cytochrome oxidase Cu insertion factor (SCO1/SenC/PrrC family)